MTREHVVGGAEEAGESPDEHAGQAAQATASSHRH